VARAFFVHRGDVEAFIFILEVHLRSIVYAEIRISPTYQRSGIDGSAAIGQTVTNSD
jgi:hypothetical protein